MKLVGEEVVMDSEDSEDSEDSVKMHNIQTKTADSRSTPRALASWP